MLGACHEATKNCIIIKFLNSAVNLWVGAFIVNLENEHLRNKQRDFFACSMKTLPLFSSLGFGVEEPQA